MGKINEWSKSKFSHEFFATLEEMYQDWSREHNHARLPDWEEAIERAKREGVQPRPAFALEGECPSSSSS